jgi:selenoprotein W-related protein
LKEKFKGVETKLFPSSGGVFEVKMDGELIFSKKEIGRFPMMGEVISIIEGMISDK